MYSLLSMPSLDRMLCRRFPGCHFTYSQEHVASKRLAHLASTSTVVVVHWQHAKHAATKCIEQNLPKGAKPYRPAGKGASSIVSTVEMALIDLNLL